MILSAAALYLTVAQTMRINYILQEAPNGLAIRSAAIFLVESSAGADKRHRDKNSHGWFQLERETACKVSGYSRRAYLTGACPISVKALETDAALNTQLGLAYIQYCAESFPDSESRAIACHRWGVPKTKAMSPAKLKKLESKGGYVWKVEQAVKQLQSMRRDEN